MNINELLEAAGNEGSAQLGTYAGVRFSADTVDSLIQFGKDHQVKNLLSPHKFHSTLLYSRKYLPNYKPTGTYKDPLIGTPLKFEIWKSNPSDGSQPTNCLVLKYDCPKLSELHDKLMKDHEATFDYPSYTSHVTLSYNVGDAVNLDKLNQDVKKIGNIQIVSEYGEDLDLNWAKTKATS